MVSPIYQEWMPLRGSRALMRSCSVQTLGSGLPGAAVEERRGDHIAPSGLGAVVAVAIEGVIVARAVREVAYGVGGDELIEGLVNLEGSADPASGEGQHLVSDYPLFLFCRDLLIHDSLDRVC